MFGVYSKELKSFLEGKKLEDIEKSWEVFEKGKVVRGSIVESSEIDIKCKVVLYKDEVYGLIDIGWEDGDKIVWKLV